MVKESTKFLSVSTLATLVPPGIWFSVLVPETVIHSSIHHPSIIHPPMHTCIHPLTFYSFIYSFFQCSFHPSIHSFFFLMWLILKVFIEFVTILLLFWFWSWGMWCLSSLTRDWTHTPCIGRWNLNHWTTREVPFCPLLHYLSRPYSLQHAEGTNIKKRF